MEVAAARILFGRSISRHKLRSTSVIGDDDAKTIFSLNSGNVYPGTEIIKEDCINHVAKRMWKGLDVLKKKLAGTKNSISGRGKVTSKLMTTMSHYYANQLKINAPDTAAMQRGVLASLWHMASRDEDPRHEFCPAKGVT